MPHQMKSQHRRLPRNCPKAARNPCSLVFSISDSRYVRYLSGIVDKRPPCEWARVSCQGTHVTENAIAGKHKYNRGENNAEGRPRRKVTRLMGIYKVAYCASITI
jgi:hypothetical protein